MREDEPSTSKIRMRHLLSIREHCPSRANLSRDCSRYQELLCRTGLPVGTPIQSAQDSRFQSAYFPIPFNTRLTQTLLTPR
jgi:hypothetical protein